MKFLLTTLFLATIITTTLNAKPTFKPVHPQLQGTYVSSNTDLCQTATETLKYLNLGASFDPLVNHEGKIFRLPLSQIKATLIFICKHQKEMQNPAFIEKHFDFVQWLPDQAGARQFAKNKPLVSGLPVDKILMTKYYVHLAKAEKSKSHRTPYPLYALPLDEANLSFEEAEQHPELIRFQYGKQAILNGALVEKKVPVLAYFNREDLESALLQGTVIADFGTHQETYNVNRNNHIAYDRLKTPYLQERYWYFKAVKGVKGYGKDAEHKITVNFGVTFAGDLNQLGLGKLLMVQYKDSKGRLTQRLGILADTGGAFENNLYQIDFLSGAYPNKEACYKANRYLPDYVSVYFMILKKNI